MPDNDLPIFSPKRSDWISLAGVLLLSGCAASGAAPPVPSTPPADVVPLTTFDFTIQDEPPEGQVQLLSRLGYAGLATSKPLPERVAALTRVPAVADGTFAIVTTLWMMRLDQPLERDYLERILPELGRAKIPFWVMFGGSDAQTTGVPDEANDKIRKLADAARIHGVTVVLYPHWGTPLLTAEQAVEWMKRVGRPNVKISLHLCHELKYGNRDRLQDVIDKVLPHVAIVSVNGADRQPDAFGWDHTIQPLDRGDLDVNAAFVQPLLARGYRGPFVLHTYGIKDPPEVHFARSMATWRRWTGSP